MTMPNPVKSLARIERRFSSRMAAWLPVSGLSAGVIGRRRLTLSLPGAIATEIRSPARVNWRTSRSSSAAVLFRSWAAVASSWAVAAVCSVDAETSSADAEDSSATEAISLVAVLMVPTRSVMSTTAWPIDSNASRVLSTVATPLWVRSALWETASAARAVSVWISPIRRGDRSRRRTWSPRRAS